MWKCQHIERIQCAGIFGVNIWRKCLTNKLGAALRNQEKKNKYSLPELLSALNCPRSSYYYQQTRVKKQDNYFHVKEKIKDIFESFTLRVPFSKSYKIHDLESVAILEERDYQEDGEVITGYISEKNKWRLEEFYDWY